jgi:hypothetical protein
MEFEQRPRPSSHAGCSEAYFHRQQLHLLCQQQSVMAIFRPGALISGPTGVVLDDECMAIRWDNLGTRTTLSCVEFHLDQYPGQVFWSYNIKIVYSRLDSNIETVISQARTTAQSISDQRVLPSSWCFSADTQLICEQITSPLVWPSSSLRPRRYSSSPDLLHGHTDCFYHTATTSMIRTPRR